MGGGGAGGRAGSIGAGRCYEMDSEAFTVSKGYQPEVVGAVPPVLPVVL